MVVIPAKAGLSTAERLVIALASSQQRATEKPRTIPAFAGMTIPFSIAPFNPSGNSAVPW
jgi:hypothetical protein